jgi:CheY-like chemotaxis protein
MRVLVIDDDHNSLVLTEYLLRNHGHRVIAVESALEALVEATRRAYDVVLSDVCMDGMDGYEMVRFFRSSLWLRSTTLIALTALAMMGDRQKTLAAGFDAYISKPIEPESFVAQIEGIWKTALGGLRPQEYADEMALADESL